MELQNGDGSTALWLALKQLDSSYLMTVEDGESAADAETFAAKLIVRGADPNGRDTRTGNTLLHRASLEGNESAAIFLVRHGSSIDSVNNNGEAAIHIAASMGLHCLMKMLLLHNANPNLCTNRKSLPLKQKQQQQQKTDVLTPPTTTPTFQHSMPSATLGALSAISSLVSSASGYSDNPFDTDPIASLQQLSTVSTNPPSKRPPSAAGSTNPFGDDSDNEEEEPPTATRPLPIGGHASSTTAVTTQVFNNAYSVCRENYNDNCFRLSKLP